MGKGRAMMGHLFPESVSDDLHVVAFLCDDPGIIGEARGEPPR